jgi:ketosteroid isomerase-like protein
MMIRLLATIILVIFLQVGCSANGPGVDLTAEIEKIRNSDRALLQAETKRDLEGVMEYLAEGAVYHPPNSPPIIGHEAIRGFYKEWFGIPYTGIHCDSDTIVVSSSGDVAYLIGDSHMELDMSTGMNRLDGKYITIWRKLSDKWLCVAVSWSGNESAN